MTDPTRRAVDLTHDAVDALAGLVDYPPDYLDELHKAGKSRDPAESVVKLML